MSGEMLPQPPPMAAPPVVEPARIKVFGIIHIVFGAMGIVMTLFSIATLVGIPFLLGWFADTAAKEAKPGDPAAEALIKLVEALKTLFSDLTIPNWVQAITSLLVGVMILMAGIALVKRRKTAVASSNRYVWVSIGAKVLNLILFFAIGMAANARYNEAIKDLSGATAGSAGPSGVDLETLQSMIASGGAVVGIVLALVYPILTYVMLNKPLVKDFLREQGK